MGEKLGSGDPAKIFKDRKDTGAELAYRLKDYKDREDVIVLGLPRGNVIKLV